LSAPVEAAAGEAIVLYWKWTVYPFVSEFRRQISAAQQQQQQQQQLQQQRRPATVTESPLITALRTGMLSFCSEVILPQPKYATVLSGICQSFYEIL
jgi:hypothetical protein